jgi:STE24 endopeptidase
MCLSFYNPSVRTLLRFLLLSAVLLLPARAQNPLPPGTPTEYTLPPEKLAQAKAFAFTGTVLYFASTAATLAALALLVRLRAGRAVRTRVEGITRRRALVILLAAPILLLIITAIDLPFDIWGHSVSLRFGISIQGWASWLLDWTKAELITLFIGTLVTAGFYWLLRQSPRRWWIWAWLASLPLTVLGVFLAPLIIDPLFNHFEPLAARHAELVAPIEAILGRAGVAIPRQRLFEMLASDKTTALNAYVTGVGTSKRVVLYDTIIQAEATEPLLTTFGHELGHYALGHIPQGIAFGAVVSFFGFWLCFRLVHAIARRREGLLQSASLADIDSLPLFALIALALSFAAEPVANAFSRWQEHQADLYSLEVTRGVLPNPGAAAARAFQIEGERDLADPTPNRFLVFWLYTHPPVADRLRFSLEYHPAVPKYVR